MKPWVLAAFIATAFLLAFATQLRPAAREELRPLPTATGSWHRVQHGENLRTLALRFYGSSRDWELIARANQLAQEPAAGCLLWLPPRPLAAMATSQGDQSSAQALFFQQ